MARVIREKARGKQKRTPYPIVIIVCDGAKSEPIYFSNFKKRNKPLQIEIVKNASGDNFNAMIKKALEAKKKYADGIESKCDVWCVTDVDVNYGVQSNEAARNSQLKMFEKEAKEHGFYIVLSNPCFELWFLLHFEYTSGHLKNYDAVMKKVSGYLTSYRKNHNVFHLLENKQGDAIATAEKRKCYH